MITREQEEAFRKRLVPKYAEIVEAACRYVHGKLDYESLLDVSNTPPSDYLVKMQSSEKMREAGSADLIVLVQELDQLEEEYQAVKSVASAR
jgi:hypothetical protein